MIISKKTLGQLRKHSQIYDRKFNPNTNYNPRIALIAELLCRSCVICGNPSEGFEVFDCDASGYALVNSDYERKTVRGMASRYPRYIEASLSNGLNEVHIIDPNSLVAAVLCDADS